MNPSSLEVLAAVLFGLALVHTFSTRLFERLAHAQPRHAKLWHLIGEVEIVFGLWAIALTVAMMALQGRAAATDYLDSRNYTEPLFVFAIMVVAASRPVLDCTQQLARGFARLLPVPMPHALYFTSLALIPLLGSLITEPAAMTLAALMLRERYFAEHLPVRMRYATLGVLFVNVSIGGALTPFAAPPVLMVAAGWGWDLPFMLSSFGAHVVPVVTLNAAVATLLFRGPLAQVKPPAGVQRGSPAGVIGLHLLLLAGIVVFAHHPPLFLGLMLLFLGIAAAYPQYQSRLMLREALLVAFFLAGLVVLGGLQQWWLQPLLMQMDARTVYLGATALTAITDNAALTYLASQVPGLSEEFKYYLVAGAISGGGLTVIANAPNPAGMSILRERFPDGVVSAAGLFLAALPPTLVTVAAFLLF
ncbi:MAG: putative Na+/H+ antiporter [Stagnimonas sp.]|nr:putative Na+/H+ antiporter [Stagnimonas sp.]